MAAQSPLLALPRELRDHIYRDVVFEEQPIRIQRGKTKHHFITRSNIVFTCKQLSEEYLEMLPEVILRQGHGDIELEANVMDMDFAWLCHFLRENARMSLQAAPTNQKMRIKLVVSHHLCLSSGKHIAISRLERWCEFCSEVGVVAMYQVDKPKDYLAGYKWLDDLEDLYVRVPAARTSREGRQGNGQGIGSSP